jgi:hypothetical protein
MSRRLVIKIAFVFALFLVAVPAAWFITLNNSPTVQRWVADHWLEDEDEGLSGSRPKLFGYMTWTDSDHRDRSS